VEIHVLQGEREFAKDNKTLGNFILDGIPPAPRGIPQVEVTFDIDANGILSVHAKDKATGKENKIVVQGSSNLNKDEIERMRKEAEAHGEEDRKRKETVEMRNQADTLISVSEKTLKDAGDKAKPEDKTSVEEKIKALKEVKDKDNVDDLKKAMDALSEAIQKVGAAMYETGKSDKSEDRKSEGAATDAPNQGGADKSPVDADFKEVPKQ
jgi:molecular chaperone DnaK